MPPHAKLRHEFSRGLAWATLALIACALLSASLLVASHSMVTPISEAHETMSLLLVAGPLSTFLLGVFLWRARAHIQQLEAEKTLAKHKAGLDPLCNLANRVVLDRTIGEGLHQASHARPLALIAIDVDGFRQINDGYGHRAGDRLLIGIAERLKRITAPGECLARLDGDEFALLVPMDDPARCTVATHQILDTVLAPIDIGPTQILASLSLGIAISPQDAGNAESLKEAADLALRRAKQEGRNRFAFFDKTMEGKLHLNKTIETDLRTAIVRGDLAVSYQPLIDRRSAGVVTLEALVRWPHPTLGVIAPEDFISLAERRGLIVPLGEWVLRRACQDARRWPGLRIAVNVSPIQFRQRDFVDTVKLVLAETGIEPSRLELELTEGVLIQDAEQAEGAIMDLRAHGVRMVLDDFGSGYSSMIYLRRFAFDKIKIDRAFLGPLETSGESAIIMQSIVSLGHSLGLTVAAEGVESPGQVEFLQSIGCDEMQGYHFAPPLTADDIDQRLSFQTWLQPGTGSAPSLGAAREDHDLLGDAA